MKYWLIFIFYTLLFGFLAVNMTACTYKIQPDQTTVEYGTTENGKNKTSKSIKQTWKWSRIKKLISP
tara:strand:- start:634 stop:834 length:201 start_codon:yes stop_codon:yes gene_type:complete